MNFLFKTKITMKPYNDHKYWIDPNAIKSELISAKNLNEAFKNYQQIINNKYYKADKFAISDNAIKHKQLFFNSAGKQAGYVITASSYFGEYFIKDYINLWVYITKIL